jgi:glycosyltransferase involved in cell wall biosynthesis
VTRTGRLAFVPPRFGPEVIGGAEIALAEAAAGLAARGWDVEILTTCARDHFTWANEYAAGVERHGELQVRRFPTVIDTARAERSAIGAHILAGGPVDLHHQQRWMNDDLRVPELYHFLLDRAEDYRAIVFAPYLFWTTFACGQIAPERTILMPCLHDEPEAWLELFQPLFAGANGLWFLSEPEAELANRIFPLGPRQRVTGSGIHVPERYDPEGFRARRGIEGRFVLYAGRREGGKRWEWLLDAFARAVRRSRLPFQLVTMGTGEVRPPDDIAERVVDLGYCDDDERNDAVAATDAYVQPSHLESFSRTIMEAWLAGTPVVANGASDVVAWHCERSGAGLTFDDAAELEQCLAFVADAPDQARAMAAAGRDYVLKHYQWPTVLDAMEETLDQWTSPGRDGSR